MILRAIEREDLARLSQWDNDLEGQLLSEVDPPRPQPLARREARYDEQIGKQGGGDSLFVIETDGQPIGTAELWATADPHGTACLTILIGEPEYRNRGYGRETIRLLLDYGFRVRNARKIWLSVFATNERAVRCYQACGFVEEGRQREHIWSNGAYVDLIYMAVFRADWQPQSP